MRDAVGPSAGRLVAALFVLAGLLHQSASPALFHRPTVDRSSTTILKASGRVPAWIDWSDGTMRVAGNDHVAGRLRRRDDDGLLWDIRNFLPPFMKVDPRRISSSSYDDSIEGFLFPTLINDDGSDTFSVWTTSDWNVGNTTSDVADESCRYVNTTLCTQDPSCPTSKCEQNGSLCLICGNETTEEVPTDLPPVLNAFQMNGTAIFMLRTNSFRDLQVQVIKMENNTKLKTVAKGPFKNVTGLEFLSLEHNSIDDIYAGAFAGLNSLLYLSLRGNQINLTDKAIVPPKHRQQNAIQYENAIFTGLPRLFHLNLADNPIGQLNQFIFWGLNNSTGFEELNLQSCDLHFIHPGE